MQKKSYLCNLFHYRTFTESPMKIALYARKYNPEHRGEIQRLVSLLERKGIETCIYKTFLELIRDHVDFKTPPKVFNEDSDFPASVDFLFSIGGDGTLLNSVAFLKRRNIPVVGLNMGHLGFLTALSRQDFEPFLCDLLSGNYNIEQRSLLHVRYNGAETSVLNEVSVHRNTSLTLLSTDVFIDGEFLTTYSGDGLIVATPTGSTAYSLSCGGPILTPNSNCLVLTPMAVHNLTFRPIIIPDTSHIRLVTRSRADSMAMGLDSNSVELPVGTEIFITKEDFPVNLVRMAGQNFFTALREKFMWGMDFRN